MKEHAGEIAGAATKVVPSLTVVGATVFGYTLQEVAAIAGCLFIVMQMAHLAWKWRNEIKARRGK